MGLFRARLERSLRLSFTVSRAEPSLPFASSLCGACAEVCPVKIDIPKILLELRAEVKESEKQHAENRMERAASGPSLPISVPSAALEARDAKMAARAPIFKIRANCGMAEPARIASVPAEELP